MPPVCSLQQSDMFIATRRSNKWPLEAVPALELGLFFQIENIENTCFCSSSSLRSLQGIFLVYDITSERSFQHIMKWASDVDEVSLEVFSGDTHWPNAPSPLKHPACRRAIISAAGTGLLVISLKQPLLILPT